VELKTNLSWNQSLKVTFVQWQSAGSTADAVKSSLTHESSVQNECEEWENG
jgi:hypothetical protein